MPVPAKVNSPKFGSRVFASPGGFLVSNPFVDAEKDYLDARARAELLKAEWEKRGSPVLAVGSTGQEVPHPLLRALNDAAVLVSRLRGELRVAHRGPKPSTVLGTDLFVPREPGKPKPIGPSPAAVLRRRNDH
jgi:hypothetical protein